jgi:hypothetical protein
VLIDTTDPVGANRPPEVTAAASSHADNPLTAVPHRRAVDAAAAAITATTSASADPQRSGTTGSGSTATSNSVNPTRRASARSRIRRTQPRTVPAGRPSRAAIRRCPHPAAANTTPAPITTASSARPTRALTGNNT